MAQDARSDPAIQWRGNPVRYVPCNLLKRSSLAAKWPCHMPQASMPPARQAPQQLDPHDALAALGVLEQRELSRDHAGTLEAGWVSRLATVTSLNGWGRGIRLLERIGRELSQRGVAWLSKVRPAPSLQGRALRVPEQEWFPHQFARNPYSRKP